jgi:hypothetical protein
MSKKLDLSKISNISPVIDKAIDLSVFRPSEDQRRAKSNFWSFFMSGDTLPPDVISLSIAAKYGCDRRMSDWWEEEGFQDWFGNKDEFRQRIELLADLALDELQKIIRDPASGGSARVSAIKLIMEASGKISKKADSPSEDPLDNMSREELQKFIKTRTARLIQSDEEK